MTTYVLTIITPNGGKTVSGQLSKTDGVDLRPIMSYGPETFAWALTRLAEYLKGDPEAGARLLRGRTGGELFDCALDDATLQLLREDPVRAIRAMDPSARRIVIRDMVPATAPAEVRMAVLAGVDTLARAVGDLVWLRCLGGQVESPFTGRWVPLPFFEAKLPFSVVLGEHALIAVEYARGESEGVKSLAQCLKWLAVRTDELLATGAARYFLYAAYCGWIAHDSLTQRYERYLKERDDGSTEQPSNAE